jgi:hypothetical protein
MARTAFQVALLLACACLGACDPTDSTDTAPPGSFAELDSLRAAPALLPADGRAVAVIRAVLSRNSRTLPRQVTFTSSDGTFQAEQASNQRTITVGVDSAGVAIALLRAPTTPTLVMIRARVGETTLQDTVRFIQALPDLTRLTIPVDSALADDVSTMLISATIRPESSVSPRVVIFKTSSGSFVSGAADSVVAKADSNGTAFALLRSPLEPGTALVLSSAGTTTLQGTVRFVPALPQFLVLNADSFRVPANPGKPLKIRASPRRSSGKVSPGTIITFSAVDSLGSTIGWFAGATETSPGTVEVSYTPGSIAYRGRVRVTGRTRGQGGVTVFDDLFLEVTDP